MPPATTLGYDEKRACEPASTGFYLNLGFQPGLGSGSLWFANWLCGTGLQVFSQGNKQFPTGQKQLIFTASGCCTVLGDWKRPYPPIFNQSFLLIQMIQFIQYVWVHLIIHCFLLPPDAAVKIGAFRFNSILIWPIVWPASANLIKSLTLGRCLRC